MQEVGAVRSEAVHRTSTPSSPSPRCEEGWPPADRGTGVIDTRSAMARRPTHAGAGAVADGHVPGLLQPTAAGLASVAAGL